MMMGGLNAKRFAGKPLRQPVYSFKDIPKCARGLEGSSLQEVTERDHFNDATAEMVLLCNETMRRKHIERSSGKRTSKPLSLEYIADRLDIDDPMFGYFVRTETPPADATDKWRQGMLQGFISVTTFTNWQKTFRWDSMHDSAFAYDDDDLAAQMASGVRRYDQDGSLAKALQSTVRCGDPWNEGIVWPRIAEISLLGGMGCGKALLSLVIEQLECMKATGKRNYDYVALQATDNSIPFYESLGFVRVGCIIEDDKFEEKQAKKSKGPDGESSKTSKESPTVTDYESKSEIVSGAVDVYVTKVAGETPADIAKELNVSVWDIIFLNQYVYKDIGTRSRLMKDTNLYVPAVDSAGADTASRDDSAPQWYIASENDTPKVIAKRFNVVCAELVQANRDRLPELQAYSRLREGTRIKVSHFHIHDDQHVPYCHWTFPDDSIETHEPSYMMVRKLDRRSGAAAKIRPVELSLSVPIKPYSAPNPEMFIAVPSSPGLSTGTPGKPSKKQSSHAGQPKKPKRPLTGYMIYYSEQRERLQDEMNGQPGSEVMKVVSARWRELPESEKSKYLAKQEKEQNRYKKAMEKYNRELADFYVAHPELKPKDESTDMKAQSLFNKVVRLNAEGVAHSGTEFEYYFVLTYIPDLKWCHLAPMVKVGTWGPDKPKAEGRPIWMLVDEGEGKEVDISAAFCEPVRSRAMKRTVDADNEQWDIVDCLQSSSPVADVPSSRTRSSEKVASSAPARKLAPIFTNRANDGIRQSRSATKPLTGTIIPKRGQGRPRKVDGPSALIDAAAKAAKVSSSESEQAVEDEGQNAKGRGRPPRQARAATKPLTGPIEFKKRRKAKERAISLVSSTSDGSESESNSDDWRSESEDDAWKPSKQVVPSRGRGQPPRKARAATKPLTGTIERRTKRESSAVKPVTRKRKVISYAEDEDSLGGSDMEDYQRGARERKAPKPRPQRGRASKETAFATGQRRSPRHSHPSSNTMEALSSLVTSTKSPAKPRGRSPKNRVEAKPPTELEKVANSKVTASPGTRSLPFRKLAPIFLSSQRALADSESGGDVAKGRPAKKRKTSVKNASFKRVITTSDYRTVALTRSGR